MLITNTKAVHEEIPAKMLWLIWRDILLCTLKLNNISGSPRDCEQRNIFAIGFMAYVLHQQNEIQSYLQ